MGVSIKFPGKPATYYAWGHPTENNCGKAHATVMLQKAWAWADGILCQNAKFDYDVATTHMGMPELPWDRIHDTMFMLFLQNPDAPSLALKPSAERLLGMPPTESDAVRQWLVDQGLVTKATKRWGAFISKAPGDLVGSYADGDVIRTEKLFNKLWPELKRRGMLQAYDRERRLMPCLLDMERRGIPVDLPRLRTDTVVYQDELALLSAWCHRRMKTQGRLRKSGKDKGKVTPTNLDSGPDLVDALILAGKVNLDKLGKTAKGAWKTSKEALEVAITDKMLAAALNHRASLQTCLNFMTTWLGMAEQSGGRIFTQWNQLKQYGEGGGQGAVTGRLSSSPNFQNIPQEFDALPKLPFKLTPLPLLRSYIIVPPGRVYLKRDSSQNELRFLAHFEDGRLKQGYIEDPWMDAHQTAMDEINGDLGTDYERPLVKQINLGLIYGMGVDLMAAKAKCEPERAKAVKAAVLAIYPGLKDLQDGLRDLARNDLPLVTWGGREYFVEPPTEDRSFEYKLLNRLVQGSAADYLKEVIIAYYDCKPAGHHLLLTVHDELLADVPEAEMEFGMDVLAMVMEEVEVDVPMLSEGFTTTTNWAELKPYDKKGVLV